MTVIYGVCVKVLRAKAILVHLLCCIAADTGHRRVSVIAVPAQQGTIPTETPLAYIDIKAIPPLPMYVLIAADKNISETQLTCPESRQMESDYNALFEGPKFTESEPTTLDQDIFGGNDESVESIESDVRSCGLQFGQKQSQLLAHYLMHTQLPGLSRLDQMYLVALAETVATENLEAVAPSLEHGQCLCDDDDDDAVCIEVSVNIYLST